MSDTLKQIAPVVHLAYTVVYVVCFCTFLLAVMLALFYMEVQKLEELIVENRNIVEELKKNNSILIVPIKPSDESVSLP